MSMTDNIDPMWQTMSLQTHPAWLAYECFRVQPQGLRVAPVRPTVKADVFAFGCVVYEVLSYIGSPKGYFALKMNRQVIHEKMPHDDCRENYLQIYARKAHRIPPVFNIPDYLRAHIPYKMIMEMCWRFEPARRPSAPKLEVILKGLLKALR